MEVRDPLDEPATRPAAGRRGAVVFLHAHPDDEAIFTGGTMARLSLAGWPVVLVVATGGELGTRFSTGGGANSLRDQREAETRRAAEVLGVTRVELLGYRDSGVAGDMANQVEGSFHAAEVEAAARRVAAVCDEEGAIAIVGYDDHGIYGHPDHVKVHQVGARAAALAGVEALYEATVDREYLHFVETHVVVEVLGVAPELSLAATSLGVPTVLVTTTVDVRPVLDRKRAAMAAHASQIPADGYAMSLDPTAFAAVYGFEWYVRHGPPGPIEELA